MTVAERIRELRREIRELEDGLHPEAVEQKRQDHLDALRREKSYAEARHAAALRLGDRRERTQNPYAPGGWSVGEKTGAEMAAVLARDIERIDAEIDRVSKLG